MSDLSDHPARDVPTNDPPPVLQVITTETGGISKTYLIESSDEIPDAAMSDGRWMRTTTPLDVERCR